MNVLNGPAWLMGYLSHWLDLFVLVAKLGDARQRMAPTEGIDQPVGPTKETQNRFCDVLWFV